MRMMHYWMIGSTSNSESLMDYTMHYWGAILGSLSDQDMESAQVGERGRVQAGIFVVFLFRLLFSLNSILLY